MSACPACGGPLSAWREVPAGEPSDPRSYELLRCARCGCAATAGPAPGPELYGEGVYAPGPPRAAGLVRSLQRLTEGQPGRLLHRAGVPRGARVLDAGAGRGRLVEALRRDGFDASGIDPSGRGPVGCVRIEDHSDSGLDAVLMWHVLEHLEDPASSLSRAAGWLRPGGVVLIGVPNLDSLQARVAGPAWLHFDAPRHRTHFTPAGLAALLERTGLRPGRAAHMVWEHNPAGMWMALLSRLGAQPGLPFHLLKRTIPLGRREAALLAAGVPALPLAALLEAVAAVARRGGTFAQPATKP